MKKPTITKLKKMLDKEYSIYIRNRDNGICFTCGKQDDIKKMQNGHYESRIYLNTRWNDENNHCQCKTCNIFKKGNYPKYATQLEKMYGYGILQKLELLASQEFVLTREWLLEKIEYYKNINEKK